MVLASSEAVQVIEEVLPLAAMAVGMVIAVVAIACGAMTSQRKTRQREESRRELAAYVAEGSMKADEAERLLKAEPED